jgi:hypothetical protein
MSSAAELADNACSTAASLAARSACLAASLSSANFLLFSALFFSAYCFLLFFLSSAISIFISLSFCYFSYF